MPRVVADLEVHSKYSRAVSPQMVLPTIASWASKKGIDLVGTGDFTHPLWIREIKANLEEVAPGLFGLRGVVSSPLFLLSTEISCIYSQGGKVRRIHILVFAPNIETVEKINNELLRKGCNLMADGRPITGLSCRQLSEIVLSASDKCLIIPAHVWTPWFGYYGSNGGFDSLEEGFGEYAKYIYAMETGLSSDPVMNWKIGELEGKSVVSFSDAHSPAKLGREATVFELSKLNYENLRKAIMGGNDSDNIEYTIEFYPEEGKYHYTGHSKCGVRQTPGETRKLGTTCPVCGKPLTVGVMHRVEQLASQTQDAKCKTELDGYGVRWWKDVEDRRPLYLMMVPLLEILSEVIGTGVSSKKVVNEYEKLTQVLGSEFNILLQTKPEEIERVSGAKLREAIMKVRSGDIFIDPGYDGVFGKVKIWPKGRGIETGIDKEQIGLF